MKILICCQDYYPTMCGVAKVVSEWAKYLSSNNHEVIVATSKVSIHTDKIINGIVVERFDISGSKVYGFKGELKKYQEFIINGDWDIVLIYAAEQWSFDGLLPVLDKIKAKKVHAPCGYASLNCPKYKKYYKKMVDHLKQFDLLVYHSNEYQDIEFAKKNGLNNLVVIPNGASLEEFLNPVMSDIKEELGIFEDELILLTIGSPPISKGHLDLIKAYKDIELDKKSVLILNGKYSNLLAFKNIVKLFLGKSDSIIKWYANKINKTNNKRVIVVNLERKKLLSLFFQADLFILASKVECSPLVLFEAIAAGLPFISAPVGNAKEISKWFNTGIVENNLKEKIKYYIDNSAELNEKVKDARDIWKNDFTWKSIGGKLEKILLGII